MKPYPPPSRRSPLAALLLSGLLLSSMLAPLPALPVLVPYSGQLAESGQLVTGTRTMRFELVGAGGVVYDSGTVSVEVTNGAFAVLLGGPGTTTLDSSIFSQTGLKLRAIVEGTPLAPDIDLPFAPYAAGGDHSALQNLAADDHDQYLPRSGIRAMTGTLDLGGQDLIGASTVYVGTTRVESGLLTVRTPAGLGAIEADKATVTDATVTELSVTNATISSNTIISGTLTVPGTSALGELTAASATFSGNVVANNLVVEGGNNVAPTLPDGLRGTPLLTSLEGDAGVAIPDGHTFYVFYAHAPDADDVLQCGTAPVTRLAAGIPNSFPSPVIIPGGNTLRTGSGTGPVLVSGLEVVSSVQPVLLGGNYTVPAGKTLFIHSLTGFTGQQGSIVLQPSGRLVGRVGIGQHLNFFPPLVVPAGTAITIQGVVTGTLR